MCNCPPNQTTVAQADCHPASICRPAKAGTLNGWFLWIILLVLAAVPIRASAQSPVIISEFLAHNTSGLVDEDGAYSDWIELYNGGASAVNLGGWYLTDDPANLTKWAFPST